MSVSSVVYLDLSCASSCKICSKVSGKPKRACKGIILSGKLDVIVLIVVNREGNKDLGHTFIWGSGDAQKNVHIN